MRSFRGDTVHPSTLRLLDDLGLWDRFAQLPQSRVEHDGPMASRADYRPVRPSTGNPPRLIGEFADPVLRLGASSPGYSSSTVATASTGSPLTLPFISQTASVTRGVLRMRNQVERPRRAAGDADRTYCACHPFDPQIEAKLDDDPPTPSRIAPGPPNGSPSPAPGD